MSDGNSDSIPLPPMCDALLDLPTVEQLFSDLMACAEVQSVLEKNSPRQHAEPGSIPIETAQERLLSGQARAIQLRYRHQGQEWCDTLLAVPGGFRLVRLAQDP